MKKFFICRSNNMEQQIQKNLNTFKNTYKQLLKKYIFIL